MVSRRRQRIAAPVLLLLVCVCLGEIETANAAAQTTGNMPAVGAGEIRSNAYRSTFFRFMYTLPDKLNPETVQAMRDKVQEGITKLPQSDQEKYKAAQAEVGSLMTWLFSAAASESENDIKAGVKVFALDLSGEEGISPAVALEAIMNSTRGEPSFAYLSPIESRQYGKADFAQARYRFERVLLGKQLRFYAARCVTLRGKYALVWMFSAGSIATLDRLIASMKSLQFQD